MEENYKNMTIINLLDNEDSMNKIVGTYSSEDIRRFLKNPTTQTNQKHLRTISHSLYRSSGQYRNLINYFSKLYNMDYVIEGLPVADLTKVDKDKYKNTHYKYTQYVEKLNIKKEFSNVGFRYYRDGVYYGFGRHTAEGFYIQDLDPDYCRVSFVDVESGLMGYSFNFDYFNKKKNSIDSFPDEFRVIYDRIKVNDKASRWQKIKSPYAFCFSHIDKIPPFVNAFDGIIDIADYKTLSKKKEKIENSMILIQQIPMRTDSAATVNNFLIDAPTAREFHDNIADNMPEDGGLITTPMSVQAIKFERDTYDKNKVGQATSQFWGEVGVSEQLFNSNNNTSAAIKFSQIADEIEPIDLIKHIEKWINLMVRTTFNSVYKFKVRILESTRFNRSEKIENAIKASSFGLPLKNEIMALNGASPSAIYMNSFLENEILNLPDILIPLTSSHTSTSDNGRPSVPTENLNENGLKNRDNGNTES